MSDLNVGIVGLGWVAGAHIETFKAVNGGTVTAICSRRRSGASGRRARPATARRPGTPGTLDRGCREKEDSHQVAAGRRVARS